MFFQFCIFYLVFCRSEIHLLYRLALEKTYIQRMFKQKLISYIQKYQFRKRKWKKRLPGFYLVRSESDRCVYI